MAGSAFPRLAVSWKSWLGLGVVATIAWSIVWTFANRWPAQVAGWPLFILGFLWIFIGLRHGCRFGWGLPPWSSASLVVARSRDKNPPRCRVVFQTPVGAVSAIPCETPSWLSPLVGASIYLFLMISAKAASVIEVNQRFLPASAATWRSLGVGLLGLLWALIAVRVYWEVRQYRSVATLELPDRTGPASLLEMARTWSGLRTQPIEAVFAATGGQGLDFAGTGAVFQMTEVDADELPTLFVSLFAPGGRSRRDHREPEPPRTSRRGREEPLGSTSPATAIVPTLRVMASETRAEGTVALIGARTRARSRESQRSILP